MSAARVPAQDREFVPQHKDLQLLRSRRPATEHHQLEQTANDEVRKRPQHAPPPPDADADATRPRPQRSPFPDQVFEPVGAGKVVLPVRCRATWTAESRKVT